MGDVTVIIPNWNGRELLASICLPSLAAQTHDAFSITVVDNGSEDGSVAFLREEWPSVHVIDVGHNSGFASAVNQGIEAASSEFIVLLNNDIELDPHWMQEMVGAARRMPEAGSFACRIMAYNDRTLITAVGDCVGSAGQVFGRGWLERDTSKYSRMEPVFSSCAGAALYRRAAFADVGLFDEAFFIYFEDVDWGFRAQLAGYSCWFVPSAVAYHLGRATTSRVSGLQAGLLARNAYWLVLKNFPSTHIARHAPALAFMVTRRFYRAFRDGHRRQALDAAVQAIRLTPAMLRKRRQIQARRRIDDRQLAGMLSHDPSVGSQKIDRLRSLFHRPGSATLRPPN
jgi:GT2 family glycosyltransferase